MEHLVNTHASPPPPLDPDHGVPSRPDLDCRAPCGSDLGGRVVGQAAAATGVNTVDAHPPSPTHPFWSSVHSLPLKLF